MYLHVPYAEETNDFRRSSIIITHKRNKIINV